MSTYTYIMIAHVLIVDIGVIVPHSYISYIFLHTHALFMHIHRIVLYTHEYILLLYILVYYYYILLVPEIKTK